MSADDSDDDRTVIRPPTPPAGPVDKTMLVGAPPAMPEEQGNGLPIGTFLAEFELTKLIGEGGFGIVYSATDHSLRRRVALKEYMPSQLAARSGGSQVQVKSQRHRETFELGLKSFVNEARLLASFDHASLLKVYRFWEANGTAYMVMPFIEGVTLKDTLREMGGPPDEAWLRTLLAPLTEALEVIHAEQCYHRDIAPDNVMLLAGSHRPLLLDFGAARRVIGDMTQALTVILKPGYAPVEQYAEIPGMKQGAWTDVYALAAVVYFAITGKTPPPSVGRLLNDTFVPLSQAAAGRYSEGFLAAIDRALAVRPEERTQSIAQLREELGLTHTPSTGLTQLLAPAPTAPPPVATPAPAPRAAATGAASAPAVAAPAAASPTVAAQRGPGLWIGLGVAALAAVGFGVYSMLTPSAPSAPPAPPPVAAAPAAPATEAPASAAAPVAVAPPAAPAGAAGFVPAREFERVVDAQTAGFVVQAQSPQTSLRIGRDEFAFTVQSERDGYLYVFAADAEGTLLQLLPNAKSGAVRIKKGQRYKFPSGDGVVLDAADPPGTVQLLAMVSVRERDHSALQPKQEGLFRMFPGGAAADAALARHTDATPLMAGKPICPSAAACEDAFGAAVMRVDVTR